MHLIAIVDIPSSVSSIPRGSEFHELNLDTAETYLKLGMARKKFPDQEYVAPVAKPVTPIGVSDFNGVVTQDVKPEAEKTNSRGWVGLNWDGQTVVVMGSGESLTTEQAGLVRAWRDAKPEERKVVVINTTFRMAPWADLLYACDVEWFDAKEKGAEKTYFEEANQAFATTRIWSQDQRAATKYGINYIRSTDGVGLNKTPGVVNKGNNSGYQIVNMLYQAGVIKQILLGFDMKGSHWHGDHPAPINSRLPFETWIPLFQRLARELKDTNCDVINATPDSALKGFKKVPLEEALQ